MTVRQTIFERSASLPAGYQLFYDERLSTVIFGGDGGDVLNGKNPLVE